MQKFLSLGAECLEICKTADESKGMYLYFHGFSLVLLSCYLMNHKYRGSQQSSREGKSKFIDLTQGEPKNIYKP
jgi:hypothetical protein